MVKIFKDGDNFQIQTNCHDEDSFLDEFSEALGDWIDETAEEQTAPSGTPKAIMLDFQFQIRWLFPMAFEIVSSLRGGTNKADKINLLSVGRNLGDTLLPVAISK